MADPQQQPQAPATDSGADWLTWALMAVGVTAVVGTGYVAYKGAKAALPFALAYGDPVLAEQYDAWRSATPEQKREMALQAARNLGRAQRQTGRPRETLPVGAGPRGPVLPFQQTM